MKNYPMNYSEITRVNDSLRNIKNLLLSGNTLFRKAAYDGGVHPIYLDELSGKWAIKIEQELSFEILHNMPMQMIRSYCLLTKEHSLSQYSQVVKDALTFINLNISSNLTVKRVAHEVSLSPDYLTRLFKIEEISDLIGINNTPYFYTLFKKEMGISPKQYRKNINT